MKKIFLFFLCLILWVDAFVQSDKADSTRSIISYGLDIGAGVYYQFSTFGNTALNTVRLSDILPRRASEPEVRDIWRLDEDAVTDVPFFHGSYFFRLGGQFRIGDDLQITAAINAEQRGFSDGVFSRRTRNFYPYFNASYAKTKGKFSYLFQAGDFWNFKLYEGLTYYNLETQSWVLKFKYDKFYFKHVGVGDLLIGIGLGIDDLYDYSVGAEDLYLGADSSMILDVRLGYSNNRGSIGGGFWNFSGGVDIKDRHRAYTQVSTNRNGQVAFLVGTSTEWESWDRLEVNSTLEFRSYSAGFNQGFTHTVYYRNPSERSTFVNSTSTVFVPLDYYERGFNQWAIFTEYQDLNVSGLHLHAIAKYHFWDRSFIKLLADFNWLTTAEESILYPLFSFGFGTEVMESTEISLEINNRVINLDKNFPSLYSSNTPYYNLRLFRPFKYLKENDRRHRR